MKTTRLLVIASLITLWGQTVAMGQRMDYSSIKLELMDKISFMVGEWEGEGWMILPNGTKSEFDQTESVESQLNGLLLTVNGKGVDKKTGKLIHNAFALISYDVNQEKFKFDAHLEDGRTTHSEGYIEDGMFFWSLKAPNDLIIRYGIELGNDDLWFEKGHFSRDGENWTQFFEMKLERTNK